MQRSCGGNNLALGFVFATERPVWLAAQRVFSKCVEYFDLHLQIPVADGLRVHSLAEQVFPGGQCRTRQCNKDYCEGLEDGPNLKELKCRKAVSLASVLYNPESTVG